MATTINGVENFWIRVRIVAGDYGKEASYQLKTPGKPEDGYVLIPANFAPPVITPLQLDYSVTKNTTPQTLLTYNDFMFQAVQPGQTFAPFVAVQDTKPTFYLGFTLPANRSSFPNRTLTLFNRVADFKYGEMLAPLWPLHSQQGHRAHRSSIS